MIIYKDINTIKRKKIINYRLTLYLTPFKIIFYMIFLQFIFLKIDN